MFATCADPTCKAALLGTLERQIQKALEENNSKEWVWQSRPSVRRKVARGFAEQMTLGLLPQRGLYAGIAMATLGTWRHPGRCALLILYLRICEAGIEGSNIDAFEITNIQLARNLRSPPHVDRMRHGPSYVATVG